MKRKLKKKPSEDAAFPIQKINENISLMTVLAGSSFFTSKTFNTTIKDLSKRFDQVFICTSNRNAHLGLMALLEFCTRPGHDLRLAQNQKVRH